MYKDYETLKIARDGKIIRVSFNRPEVRNATNPRMHQELVRIFPEIGCDPEAFVVILSGEGQSFSAGGDVSTMKASIDDHVRWAESMVEARAILTGVLELDRPVIAKVNGHAIGLGATLALFSDIIVAADGAKIADPHVGIGLSAGDGGSVIWPLLIGYARAKKYLLTGKPITGAEAAAIGLITEAVPAAELDARVDAIAREIADGAAAAIRFTKKSVNMKLRQDMDALIEAHLGYETLSHLSADHREAVHAFLEKRKPVFTGR